MGKFWLIMTGLLAPAMAHAATFDEVQSQIFTPSCALSGCHANVQQPILNAGVSFDNIVGVRASTGINYVEPGDPDNSYIVNKVEGVGISGSRMPLGGAPLSTSNIQLLRDWISAGALEVEPEPDPVPDPVAVCDDPEITGPDAAASSLTFEQRVAITNPASNTNKQSFLRFINRNETVANVEIYGIDDAGLRSRDGAVSFQIPASASLQMTAQDLENGNAGKGLTGSFCDGTGKWQLIVRSSADLDVQSLIRTTDGFLTGVSETAPQVDGVYQVYFANGADNTDQETFLRIVNNDSGAGTVTVSAWDDTGSASPGTMEFSLEGRGSIQLTATKLEQGTTDTTGSLGDGSGRWWVKISSDLDLSVMSLIRSPGGFLTNLSGISPSNESGDALIYFANPASETDQASLIRIVNASADTNIITVSGTDDLGQVAPAGDVQLTLAPYAATLLSMTQLEQGDVANGLSGSLGDGSGRWRLRIAGTAGVVAQSLIETTDGFLTNISSLSPTSGSTHQVLMINPASNVNKVSLIRLVNPNETPAAVSITGIDDNGTSSGPITVNVAANNALELDAVDLESGNAEKGLVGSLGDGAGKWRLQISSSENIAVMGLMQTTTGLLSNLSQAAAVANIESGENPGIELPEVPGIGY